MSLRVDAQKIFRQLYRALDRLEALAIANDAGETIATCLSQSADAGLLAEAATNITRYFKPKPGEVFLLNDPYSGGSGLAQITFVGCFSPGWLLIDRLHLKPDLRFTGHIDQEGLRIPPTPIVMNNEINSAVLDAIRSHPLIPEDFDRHVPGFLEAFRSRLKQAAADMSLQTLLKQPDQVEQALEFSMQQWRERLLDLAGAEAIEELVLEDKSRLRVKATVRNGEVTFDFAGTSPLPNVLAVPDRATAGICLATLMNLVRWTGPVHSGLFHLVKVLTPMGSMVNAKFPAATSLGLRDGAQLIAMIVSRALIQIDRSLEAAESSPTLNAFTLTFGGDTPRTYYDQLKPGHGATQAGVSALELPFYWRPKPLTASLERVEERYPIRFHACLIRRGSGGKGEVEGVPGETKVLQVLAPATLRWQMAQFSGKIHGAQGGKAGLPPEIAVLRAQTKTPEVLGFQGEIELAPGDQVLAHSGGGGGYGAVTEDE